jgi:hypothetical protein
MKTTNAILVFACLVVGCALPLWAQQQQKAQLEASVVPVTETALPNSTSAPTSAITNEPSVADPGGSTSSADSGSDQAGGTANDDQWHFATSPYFWIAGIHGALGAFNRNIGFKVSPNDLLSHARFGLMGLTEARRNQLVTNLDLIYLRLGADNQIPFPPSLNSKYANFTLNVVILTPKIGLRLVDEKKIKIDALTGIRYWYFGENLSFNPSTLGLNFSRSQNWVGPVIGGKFEFALSPKIVTTIAGDVGGWGNKLDYQAVGALGYKLKPNLTLQAGYRQLYVNYPKPRAILDLTVSGAFLGATLILK